jgi:hypothetical protein
LLRHGFKQSRLVLMNEAHSGERRCIRTREVGRALLPDAHAIGARHLAMEALWDRGVTTRANASRHLGENLAGYLGQPEMRALVQTALDLGWTLHSYEADIASSPHAPTPARWDAINWRDDQQARNLGAVIAGLPSSARVLGWCGNGHLCRSAAQIAGEEDAVWTPMGSLVSRYCHLEPFSIDQTITVAWDGREPEWLAPFTDDLEAQGGTAGLLAADLPEQITSLRHGADAYVLSLDNAMTVGASPP